MFLHTEQRKIAYVSLMRGAAPELVGCRTESEELDGLVAWVRAAA